MVAPADRFSHLKVNYWLQNETKMPLFNRRRPSVEAQGRATGTAVSYSDAAQDPWAARLAGDAVCSLLTCDDFCETDHCRYLRCIHCLRPSAWAGAPQAGPPTERSLVVSRADQLLPLSVLENPQQALSRPGRFPGPESVAGALGRNSRGRPEPAQGRGDQALEPIRR